MRRRLFVLFAVLLGPATAAQGNPEAWIQASVPPAASSAILEIVDTATGLVALGSDALLYRSTDGGDTWALWPRTGGPSYLYDLFPDGAGGLLAGGENRDSLGLRLYRSADGSAWEPLARMEPSACEATLESVWVVDASPTGTLLVGTACQTPLPTYGQIWRSSDGGATWTVASDWDTGFGRVTAFAADVARRYASRAGGFEGDEPGLQRSDDDGVTWMEVPAPPGGTVRHVAASGGSLLAVTIRTGQVESWRSADQGATWAETALDVESAQARFYETADGAVYLVPDRPSGVAGVARTRDGGLSWEVLDDGIGPYPVTALVAGADGRLHAATYDADTQTVAMYRTAESVVATGEKPSSAPMTLEVAPNPVAGATRVAFTLAEASPVSLVVADALGRQVATVASGVYSVGRHEAAWDAGALPAGVYAVMLRAGRRVESRRVTVLR